MSPTITPIGTVIRSRDSRSLYTFACFQKYRKVFGVLLVVAMVCYVLLGTGVFQARTLETARACFVIF